MADRELNFEINANTRGFLTGLNRASDSVQKFRKQNTLAKQTVLGVSAAMTGAISVVSSFFSTLQTGGLLAALGTVSAAITTSGNKASQQIKNTAQNARKELGTIAELKESGDLKFKEKKAEGGPRSTDFSDSSPIGKIAVSFIAGRQLKLEADRLNNEIKNILPKEFTNADVLTKKLEDLRSRLNKVNESRLKNNEVLEENIKKHAELVKKFKKQKNIQKASEASKAFGKALGAVSLAAAAVIAALTAVVFVLFKLGQAYFQRTKEALQFASSIGKISRETDISVKNLQRWRATLARAGVETDELSQFAGDLSEKIDEFRKRNPEAIKTFRALGIEFSELEGKTQGQQLIIIAKALDQINNQARKTTIARQLFGDDGATKFLSVVQEIVQNGNKLANLPQSAILSEEQVKKSQEVLGIFKEIRLIAKGVISKAVLNNVDTIKEAANSVKDALVDLANSGELNKLVKNLSDLFSNDLIIDTLNSALVILNKMLGAITSFGKAYNNMIESTLDLIGDKNVKRLLNLGSDNSNSIIGRALDFAAPPGFGRGADFAREIFFGEKRQVKQEALLKKQLEVNQQMLREFQGANR